MLLTTSNVQIGGVNDHNFDGEIKDFEMSFGSTGIRIDLINLKLFFGLLAMVSVGFIIQKVKSEKKVN
jgi:hypothetical protein